MAGELANRTRMPNDHNLMLEEMLVMLNEIASSLADIKTQFEAHTHNGNGAQAGSYFTSPPRTDAATVTLGTARTLTVATPTQMSF